MRAAPLPLLVGVVTLSRTYRAVRAVTLWYVRLDREPVTVTAVVQVEPSVLVWIVYAPVFQPVVSPPRPACFTTNCDTDCAEPRSTWRNSGDVSEHHLLLLASAPSTAFGADSVDAQTVEPVAVLFSARFVPSAGGAAGGVKPSLNDGGTSAPLLPQLVFG